MDTAALQSWLLTHAAAVVGAPSVLGFEPRQRVDYSASPTVFAGWLSGIRAVPGRGGLNTTGAAVIWNVRAHRGALGTAAVMTEAERAILAAVDALAAAYFSDVEIAAGVSFDPRNMSESGEPYRADLGYLDLDKQLNRIATVTVTVLVDDAWTETP